MFRKFSVGLLTTTFFAVLVSSGIAIASQSVPQHRLSLVLGQSCLSAGEACRNDDQCCSGTCKPRSFLPWVPGRCTGSAEEGQQAPQPTRPSQPSRPPQPTRPEEPRTNAFKQRQCQLMNQYTKRLETQLQKAEQEMQKLRGQIQTVQEQANQMCQEEDEGQPAPTKPPGNLPD